MSIPCVIETAIAGTPTLEGAGVRLNRMFGNREVPMFDPFLLLDDFGSDRPEDYLKGFPWHPHRGIETVTYMLHGEVTHGDSLGNEGTIRDGDIQWMTAGSGIVHQEMPQLTDGRLRGFQLWVKLPASLKMTAPAYREVKASDVTTIDFAEGVTVKLVSGSLNGSNGPLRDLLVDVDYFDIFLEPGASCEIPEKKGYRSFLFVFEGEGTLGHEDARRIEAGFVYKLGPCTTAPLKTNQQCMRLLFVSGKPHGEPVAWGGPIVMNTQEELKQAFAEYHDGTFLKDKPAG